MKINRFIALAAIALLIVGGMGAVATHSLAASKTSAPAQSQDCSQQDDDGTEVADAEDSDAVEEQCGDQNEDDGAEEAEAADSAASEADEAAALQGQATISAADAEAAALAANPGTSVVQTELDDENGSVVYSVELDNGSDVKVDAANGTIVATETGAED